MRGFSVVQFSNNLLLIAGHPAPLKGAIVSCETSERSAAKSWQLLGPESWATWSATRDALQSSMRIVSCSSWLHFDFSKHTL